MMETYVIADGRATIDKSPDAVLLYGLDLTDWLAQVDDTLKSVTTTARGVSVDSSYVDGSKVLAWVSGGKVTRGVDPFVTFHFVTDKGGSDSRSIYFNIVKR